jgi:FkbM family methyltransferase
MLEEIFKKVVNPLVGTGIGRVKLLANIYQKMATKILPNEKVIEVQGFKIKVVTQGHIGDISTELLFKGVHEPMSTQVFKRLINEGDCVVDVGANIGYFTLLAARLVGQSGRVFAFEPSQDNMVELENNLAINNFCNVTTSLSALSDYNGRSKFFMSTSESARHSLIQTHEHDAEAVVNVQKLDDVIDYKHIPVHFLKTDTEGNELAVLKGAEQTINANKGIKLLFEVYFDALKANNVEISELWNYVNKDLEFNYIYLVDDYKQTVFRVHTFTQVIFYCQKNKLACNLLCNRDNIPFYH